MWLVLGFAGLGFLLGNLVGLTSEPVVKSTIALLFALFGGSIVIFLHRLSQDDRRLAGQMIASLAFTTLLGTVSGILISEHQLLSPGAASRPAGYKPLRDESGITDIDAIDREYMATGNGDQAYKRLRALLTSQSHR